MVQHVLVIFDMAGSTGKCQMMLFTQRADLFTDGTVRKLISCKS